MEIRKSVVLRQLRCCVVNSDLPYATELMDFFRSRHLFDYFKNQLKSFSPQSSKIPPFFFQIHRVNGFFYFWSKEFFTTSNCKQTILFSLKHWNYLASNLLITLR